MEKILLIEPKKLEPSRKDFEVIGVFNPGVIKFNDEYIMIARVAERVKQDDPEHYLVPTYIHGKGMQIIKLPKNSPNYDYSDSRMIKNHQKNYLTSISHFRIFRSKDGLNFDLSNIEFIMPSGIYEEYGIEDPRITQIEDEYYITYSAISSCGINVSLKVTKDFRNFTQVGNILHSDNKDCVIFPEKINDKYYALHRPSISQFGKLDIWTAESNNLVNWGNHKILLDARVTYTESSRVGAGAVPILTDRGWLEIYHSADIHDHYHLTAMLLDKENPNKILMKSKQPLIQPTEDYEKNGFVKDVVFSCGLIKEEDEIMIYYGVCDERIACAKLTIDEIWNNMEVL
jgi:predicted GH43/DUF377 family glycosyl hydrolase